jgi:hypothetical protein
VKVAESAHAHGVAITRLGEVVDPGFDNPKTSRGGTA